MIGKLLGKVAGEVLALPATIAKQMEDAVDETAKTIDKRYDAVEKNDKKKS